MWRYWVGAAAALLLVAGGVFYWRSTASAKHNLPSPPAASGTADNGEDPEVLPAPPEATEKTREEKRFSRADHDKNGMVSRDEFLAARKRNFAKLDVNNDGKLSFDEYAVKAEDKFAQADADHSGGLNPTEFATTKVARKAKASCSCERSDRGKSDDGD